MIARTAEGATPDVALGVCDPDMNVALDAALREYGWGLHNPEGKPFAGTGVMDLLRHLRQALEEKGAARPGLLPGAFLPALRLPGNRKPAVLLRRAG